MASLEEPKFGVVPALPTFKRDDSAFEASSKISEAKFKLDKFLNSLSQTYQSNAFQQVRQPPPTPVNGGGGLTPAVDGGGGLSSDVVYTDVGDGGPPGDDGDDGDGLGDRKDNKGKDNKCD